MRDLVFSQQLRHTLSGAAASGGDHHTPLVLCASGKELHHLFHAAAVADGLTRTDRDDVCVLGQLGIQSQGSDGPPAAAVFQGGFTGLGQSSESTTGEGGFLLIGDGNRAGRAVAGGLPGCGEELIIGGR